MSRAGAFRDLVRFDRRGDDDDGLGNEQSGDWEVLLDEIWADAMERPGGEKLAAGQFDNMAVATVRVRLGSDTLTVREGDSIVFRRRRWKILSINEVGQVGDVLEFSCEAGGAI